MAKGTSLKSWENQFTHALDDVNEIQAQLKILKDLVKEIAKDMKRFEKWIEKDSNEIPITELLTSLMGFAKITLVQQFMAVEELTEGDITNFMMTHLLEVIKGKLIPTIEYVGGNQGIEVNLIKDCQLYLGTVGDWFALVDAARVSRASTPESRMIGWRQIFDAGVLGYAYAGRNQEKLAYYYEKVMATRYALLNDSAPYWYFMEYGNEQFSGGILYPHPSYGAPKAVSTAIEIVKEKAIDKLIAMDKIEKAVTRGWHQRKELLDRLSNMIRDIEDQGDKEDGLEILKRARNLITRGLKRQIKSFRGKETLDNLSKKELRQMRELILSDILNGDEFKGKIYHPAFPSGVGDIRIKNRVERYLPNIGFADIGLV